MPWRWLSPLLLVLATGCFVDVPLQGRACNEQHACVEGDLCIDGVCWPERFFGPGEEHGACRDAEPRCDATLACVDDRCAGSAAGVDAGTPEDAGALPEDGGVPLVDGGLPPVDGGVPPVDGGVPAMAPPLLAGDLVAYWSFNNDPADDVIADFAGALDGVALGAGGSAARPTRVVGAFASALRFDGDDDEVVVPSAPALDLGARYSIEVSVRVDGTCPDDSPIVSRISGGPSWNLSCRHEDGVPRIRGAFRDIDGFVPEVTSPSAVDDGAWHHVVLVRDGQTLSLYVDGDATSFGAQLGGTDSAASLHIGGHSGGGVYFKGDLDEVRVWRRALAADDIAALGAAFRPGLIGYWAFEGDVLNLAGASFPGAAQQVLLGDGLRGQGAQFDGEGSVIHVTTLPDSLFGASYTASLWFRTTVAGEQQLLFDGSAGRDALDLRVEGDLVRARIGTPEAPDALVATVPGVFDDGDWHHAVMVRDGADGAPTTLRLYVDGGAAASAPTSTPGTSWDADAVFNIGYRVPDDPRRFRGDLDELQVWTRALTVDEVTALYATRP